MQLKRIVVLGGVLGGVAALVAGAATSVNRHVDAPIAVAAPAIEESGAELAAEIARLHERLRPTAAPQQPARNLFQFNASKAPRVPAQTVAVAAPVAAAVERPRPSFALIGVAEDADADGQPVRTAIISGAGELFLVKEGDAVTSHYRVGRISGEAVELTATDGDSPLHLGLR